MKSVISALAFFLFCASLLQGQSTADLRVTLTGTITDVQPVFDFSSARFNILVYVQFKNESNTPLIIFTPRAFIGKKRLVFSEDFSSRRDSDESSDRSPTRDKYKLAEDDPFPNFLRNLAAPEPDKYNFVIITPGGYYECFDKLTVAKGYFLELRAGQDKYKATVVADYPELKIEYYLSLNDRPPNTDALATAQRKWSKFGDLMLDANGDYRVISNNIMNRGSKSY